MDEGYAEALRAVAGFPTKDRRACRHCIHYKRDTTFSFLLAPSLSHEFATCDKSGLSPLSPDERWTGFAKLNIDYCLGKHLVLRQPSFLKRAISWAKRISRLA